MDILHGYPSGLARLFCSIISRALLARSERNNTMTDDDAIKCAEPVPLHNRLLSLFGLGKVSGLEASYMDVGVLPQ